MKHAEHWGPARPYHETVKRDMRGFVRASVALGVLTLLVWLGSCSDGPGGPGLSVGVPSDRVVVSDPVPAAGLAQAVGVGAPPARTAVDEVVYVSLPPGTAPTGSIATVRRVGDGFLLSTGVLDGGFDPVPLGAQVDDAVDVLV